MKKGRLYNIIRWLTPYGIVSSYVEKNYRRRHNFIECFKQYVESGQQCELVEDNPYETIVSVNGFGYSGSGAVVDLLREYDSTHVIGFVDDEGSVASRDFKCDEVDVLRLAGGLFEVEKYIGSNNVFQNDVLLHRVVALFENSDIYKNNPSVRTYCFAFMSHISEVLTDSPSVQDYNQHINLRGANDILFLKEFTTAEYRNWCRKLLNSIFSVIRQATGDKPILILDQIVNDFEFDTELYKDYIPNLKNIMVYRDPRDVYLFAKKANIGWIPHKSADVFVKWYKKLIKLFNINEQKLYQVIQFEKLIEDYDEVVASVEQFVGLQAHEHTKKGTCLAASKSQANIKLWQKEKFNKNEYDTIYVQLQELCYTD